MSNIIRQFEDTDIVFKMNKNGTSEVRIDEVAKFCGWTRIAKSGNEVIRWERVNGFLEELGVPTCGHGDYIPEFIMYPLISKANSLKATQFMLWVGQILVELRTKGVVILENAKEEAIDFAKKYGTYKIRKTFKESKDAGADYSEFKELAKTEDKAGRLNNADKIKLSNIIISTLKEKLEELATIDLFKNAGNIITLQQLLIDIEKDTMILNNRMRGGFISYKTKQIKSLIQQLPAKSDPLANDFITLDVHGFSNNYMYTENEQFGTVKTEAYRKWIRKFPVDQLPALESWDLNLEKPLEVFLEYTAKAEFDIRNFDKSMVDTIFHELGIDDNLIDVIHSKRLETVDSYSAGQTRVYIRNV